MARPVFSLTDDQARALVERMPALVANHPRDAAEVMRKLLTSVDLPMPE